MSRSRQRFDLVTPAESPRPQSRRAWLSSAMDEGARKLVLFISVQRWRGEALLRTAPHLRMDEAARMLDEAIGVEQGRSARSPCGAGARTEPATSRNKLLGVR
jgi:hypothetical protein